MCVPDLSCRYEESRPRSRNRRVTRAIKPSPSLPIPPSTRPGLSGSRAPSREGVPMMRIDVRSNSAPLPPEVVRDVERRCRVALSRIDDAISDVRVVFEDGTARPPLALVSVRIAAGPEMRMDATGAEPMEAFTHALDRVARAAHRWVELRRGVAALSQRV